MTARREGKGGGEKRNKAILSGFSCDCCGEMLTSLLLSLLFSFPPDPRPPSPSPQPVALTKYY